MRGSEDKFLSMTAVVLGHIPLSLLGIAVFGFPNWDSVNFVLASSVLHFFYQIFLLNAYKYGQLSQVYPVARGLSPLIIVVVSSIFIGEVLSKFELIGVICVSVALLAYGIKINFQSKKKYGWIYFCNYNRMFYSFIFIS